MCFSFFPVFLKNLFCIFEFLELLHFFIFLSPLSFSLSLLFLFRIQESHCQFLSNLDILRIYYSSKYSQNLKIDLFLDQIFSSISSLFSTYVFRFFIITFNYFGSFAQVQLSFAYAKVQIFSFSIALALICHFFIWFPSLQVKKSILLFGPFILAIFLVSSYISPIIILFYLIY